MNIESTENNPRPVAVITGASAGIGAVFARALARRGCDVVLVARRRERLDALAAELQSEFEIQAEALPADLTDDAELRRVAERIAQMPNLEYLINNAGFGTLPLFGESDADRQDAMARLHVLAPTRLTHAALGPMLHRRRGFIINVASVAGFFASPSNVMYCSTKAWMVRFSEALAIELADTPLVVQALCPGFTTSEFHDVMKMDRALVPKAWWLRAEDVVEDSLSALKTGKLIVIPSLRYKLVTALLRILPRPLRNYLAAGRHRRNQKISK